MRNRARVDNQMAAKGARSARYYCVTDRKFVHPFPDSADTSRTLHSKSMSKSAAFNGFIGQ